MWTRNVHWKAFGRPNYVIDQKWIRDTIFSWKIGLCNILWPAQTSDFLQNYCSLPFRLDIIICSWLTLVSGVCKLQYTCLLNFLSMKICISRPWVAWKGGEYKTGLGFYVLKRPWLLLLTATVSTRFYLPSTRMYRNSFIPLDSNGQIGFSRIFSDRGMMMVWISAHLQSEGWLIQTHRYIVRWTI